MLSTKEFIDARLYPDESALIQDALRHLLRARPGLRLDLAVYRYQAESLSLAKAAEFAGVSWAQLREVLLEKGITPRLGPVSVEEARQEVETLRESR